MVNYLPLRHLLLGILVAFGLLVAAGQFAFMLRTYYNDGLSEVEALARHSGSTLAANLEAALREGDERFVAHLVVQQITLPHLEYAAFVGGDDRVRASSRPGLEAGFVQSGTTPPPPALVTAARRTLAGQVDEDRQGERLWAVFPVRLPVSAGEARAREVGYAVLMMDTRSLRRSALRQAVGQGLIALAPILLLSAGIAVLVKFLLTDRIEQLLAYARSQARGSTLARPVTGNDELGMLGIQLSALMKEVVASRDYHIRLLDRLPNPIWRTGPDGSADYFNRAWLAFTGRGLAEERGDGWLDSLHPADRDSFVRACREAIVERAPFSIEARLCRHDGRYHWLTVHGEPVFDPEGRLQAYIGSCFDVQQEKDAAAAIAASEERFRGLVERTLVGVYLIRDGRMLYANPRLAEWFGYPSEDLAGMPVANLVHPDDRAMVRDKLMQRERGEIDFVQYTFRGLRRDGSAFPVEVYGNGIEYEGERAVIGTLIDHTQRAKYEAALKAAAEVVEASPTVLFRWLAEPGWPVAYVSENVDRWGYRASELLAASFHFFDLLHPDDRERISGEVAEFLAEGRNEYAQEYRIRVADGSYIWVEDLTAVQRDEAGGILHIEGLLTDISERRRAEEEVRALNAELEARVAQRTAQLAALNKELETFAYSVSHDLKAPLRGIDGYSHLLVEDYADRLDEEGQLFIKHIRAGVKQMARLIDDLLAYSRVERRTLQCAEVNLLDMVRGILAERVAELESSPARIVLDVPPLRLRADPEGLAQALRNLFDNALKYSRDAQPPEICISAVAEGELCHIRVQDNGIGFDMKFHDRIFEIFQRLQRSEDYAGTGVGLAIVRKAVQRMGGRVWAESAPGEGACFHLELPR